MRFKTQQSIFISLFSGLLLGISILIYQVSYTALKNRVIANSELFAQQITKQFQRNILFIEEDMKLFAVSRNLEGRIRSNSFDDLPSNALLQHRFISFFETEYGYKLYEKIALYDTSGNVLRSPFDCENPSQEAWWHNTIEDGASYALIDSPSGLNLVSIAVALHDNEGNIWAVMQATISMSSLIRGGGLSLSKMNATQLDILTVDGAYIYSTALHTPGQKAQDVVYSHEHEDEPGILHTHKSGVKTIDIVAPYIPKKRGSLRWNLILHLDYNKTFAQLHALRWWIGGSVFGLLTMGIVFIFFITRNISAPLANITASTEQFGLGNMSERIAEQHSGEFKVLANAFNNMANNIEHSKERLESEVEERTMELSEANETLLEEIEERSRTQEALQESEQHMKEVLFWAPVPMCVVGGDGKINLINEAFTKKLGYSSDDVRTMDDWWKLAYPDRNKRREVATTWEKIVDQAKDHGLEIDPLYREVVRKDGKMRTVEIRVMPLGEAMVITMLDLTDQFKLVEELTESQAKLAESQRLSHMGSWGWDIASGSLWWSDETYRIFGLRPDRSGMTYDRFLQAIHPDDKKHVQDSIRLALQEDVHYNIEHRIVLPEGEIKIVHERGRISRDDNGRPTGMVGTVQDVTERSILEEQLIQATKMESIGTLSAGIAHEINTPTQFIQHNMRFIQQSFEDLSSLLAEYEKLCSAAISDPRLSDALNAIEKQSEEIEYSYLQSEIPTAIKQSLDGLSQISRIVQSVKRYAHTSSGEKVPTDINRLIETVITVSTNEWKYHSEINIDLEQGLPAVPCVSDQMNQALLNLVVNAAHTNTDKVQAGDGQKVGMHISTKSQEDHIIITIRDEGMGISKENRSKIFDPFFSTKEVGMGTGQGLTLAYRTIVDEHGGSIDFATVEGKGTTFTVSLPIRVQ